MFLCAGESLVDLVVSEMAKPIHAHAGGGPANTARALAAAGVPTSFFGGFSSDVFGVAERDALTAAGVDSALSVVSDLPSALAIAHTSGEHTDYSFHVDGTATFAIGERDVPVVDSTGDPFELIHLGGLGTAIAPFADGLSTAVLRWKAAGSLVAYDPNIRAGLEHRGQDVQSVEHWVSLADIVKVSKDDLTALEGGTDPFDIVARWLGLGPALIVLTDGPRSVRAETSSFVVDALPDPVSEDLSPIGAGDAFSAGFLACLRQQGILASRAALSSAFESDIADALRYAIVHTSTVLHRRDGLDAAGLDPTGASV
jgi:fructokinase